MLSEFETRLSEDGMNYLHKVAEHPCSVGCNEPWKIFEMMRRKFNLDRMAEEYMYALAMDARSHPIAIFEISHGSVSNAFCQPREIMIRMLLSGASSFALIHNHPSGDANPSMDDVQETKRVSEAAKLIGIKLVDHIIIGHNTYVSLLERELL